MRLGQPKTLDNTGLAVEECLYIAVIVSAFCALATQKLIHYPLGLMAVGAVALLATRARVMFQPHKFLLPCLFLLIWLPMCLGTINAVERGHSLATTLAYLHFLPAAYFILCACSRPKVFFWVERCVVFLMAFIVVDALLQFFNGFNFLGYPYDTNRDTGEKLTGVFYPKERLGLILSVLAPVLFYFLAKARFIVVSMLLFTPAFLFVMLMTFKRNAWVMLIVVVAYFFIFLIFKYGKTKATASIKYMLIFIFVAGATIAVSPNLQERLSENHGLFSGDVQKINIASNYRISLWRTGYKMFQENPLLGIGPRGFRHVYEQYAGPDDYWLQNDHRGQTHPHSNIVEVLVETGLLGLAGYLLFYSYFLVRFFKEKCFSTSLIWTLTVLVVWCPLNTHLAFYGSYWSSFAWMLIAISLASPQHRFFSQTHN